jgi:hypothetical protein
MPVTSLISPVELLLPRPVEAVAPLPATPSAPGATPVRETETRPPLQPAERPETRRYTPAEERRQRVDAIARRNEQRVENEVVQATNDRLEAIRANLDRIVELTTQAQDTALSDEERAFLVQQAREFAGQTEDALPATDPFQRPEVASLATIALRPEVLALADAARAPRDFNEDASRLQIRAIAARNRIEQVQRDILRPEQRRADFTEQETELVLEERDRLQSPADATRVANEVRAESRVNSGDLFLALANVLPQNALSLLAAI